MKKQSWVFLLSSLLLTTLSLALISPLPTSLRNRAENDTFLHAANKGAPFIHFSDGTFIRAQATGSPALRLALELGKAKALTLAQGDFNEDGIEDLIAGYGHAERPLMGLYLGSADAIYPYSEAAQVRKQTNHFSDAAFQDRILLSSLPERPDFLATGDFDADGHLDLALASRETPTLHWLPGNGQGEFGKPRTLSIPGTITTLLADDLNRPDGLTDLAVGVSSATEHQLLVFEGPAGALQHEPEAFSLQAPATALATAPLDDHYAVDLAVATGTEVWVLRGRDRQLSSTKTHQASVRPAGITRHAFPAHVEALAAGQFLGSNQKDLAIGLENGTLALLDLDANTVHETPYTFPTAPGESLRPSLSSLRVSSLRNDDLALLDPAGQQIQLFHEQHLKQSNSETQPGQEGVSLPAPAPEPITFNATGTPAAVTGMRLNADALNDLVVLDQTTGRVAVARTSPSSTFVVNDSGEESDTDWGDGTCETPSGTCTFRAATEEANYLPGADLITFSVSEVVSPNYRTYYIRETATIDGTSQGHVQIPSSLIGHTLQVAFEATDVVVRGLNITSIFEFGAHTLFEDNYVNTTPDGQQKEDGYNGALDVKGNGTIVGGASPEAANVTTMLRSSQGEDIRIEGNFIGISKTGDKGLGEDMRPVSLNNITRGVLVNNVVGGSANDAAVQLNVNSVIVQNNRIGVDISGTQAIPNDGPAIQVNKGIITIGGTAQNMSNILSSSSHGISIFGADSLIIQGNFIGTDITGTKPFGNVLWGIYSAFDPDYVLIGGTTPSAANVIGNNGRSGIYADGIGPYVILSNFIGTDRTGLRDLGNTESGIVLRPDSGSTTGSMEAPNVIANNRESGIRFSGGKNTVAYNRIYNSGERGIGFWGGVDRFSNKITRNAIYDNGSLGIALSTSSNPNPKPNDDGDTDDGLNMGQNYPELSLITPDSIRAALNSTPNTSFTFEFFGNPECDPSGHGEGKYYLYDAEVVTNAQGIGILERRFATSVKDRFITATATDPDGNTSEFSNCVETDPSIETLVVQVMQDSVGRAPSPIPNTWFEVGVPDLSSDESPLTILKTLQSDEKGFLYLDTDLFDAGQPYFIQVYVENKPTQKANHDAVDDTAYDIWADNLYIDQDGHIFPDTLEASELDTTVTYVGHTTLRFNLVAVVEWKANQVYVDRVKAAFQHMSRFLFDATNGQAYLNNIALYGDAKYWNDADIWIHASNLEWPRAHVNGIGQADKHIFMPPRFFGTEIGNINGTYAEDPLAVDNYTSYATFVHEMGHFILNLYDEYINSRNENIYPNINFSMMDNQYNINDPASSELSAWITPEYRNTNQYQSRDMTGWANVQQHFSNTDGPVPTRLHTPLEQGVPEGGVVAGPTTDDLDAGALLMFQNFMPAYTLRRNAYRFTDEHGTPQGGIEAALIKKSDQRWVKLGKSVLANGQNKGKILLLGIESEDAIIAFNTANNEWRWAIENVGALGKTAEDVITVQLKPVTGQLNMLPGIAYEAGGSMTYSVETVLPDATTPTYTLLQGPNTLPDQPLTANAEGFHAALADLEAPQATLLFSAKDSADAAFMVPHNLTLTGINPGETWLLPAGQDLEFHPEGDALSLTELAVLSSDFPAPTTGLPDSVRRVTPVFSLDALPLSVPLTGRLMVYHSADTLFASVPEAVTIYRWEADQWVARLTNPGIEDGRLTATTVIEQGGKYAAFLDLTRATGVGIESEREDRNTVPQKSSLLQNYPNPFAQQTTIPFMLDAPDFVTIKVYDLLGRQVALLTSRRYDAGEHTVTFRADNHPAGLYFYELKTSTFTDVRHMVLAH